MVMILMIGSVRVMFANLLIFGRLLWDVVVMEMKESLDQKHREEPDQQPTRSAVDRVQLMPGMREQMQDSNPQHQPGDEARRHLHSGVSQPDEQRYPPASQ